MSEYKAKFVMLGNANVGKSTISNIFVSNTMSVGSTVGATFFTKNISNMNVQLWDTAGQEKYRCIIPMYYRGAQIFIIVFDVSDYSSWEGVQYWYDEINRNIIDNPIIIVVGNKTDLGCVIPMERIKHSEEITGINIEFFSMYDEKAYEKINFIFEMAGKRLYETILSRAIQEKEHAITLTNVKMTRSERLRYGVYRVKNMCNII